jgi:hypothetical protein
MVTKVNNKDLSSFCGVKLRVLPDFLMDHTLLQEEFAERLPEHCNRWTQFVQRLWAWRGQATFCLRFDGRPQEGAVGIYLLARPHAQSDRQRLQRDMEFALSAYGVLNDVNDPQRCLPLLTPEEIRSITPDTVTRELLTKEIQEEFGKVLEPNLNEESTYIAVVQEVTDSLWKNRNILTEIFKDPRLSKFSTGTQQQSTSAWIPLLWQGPVGSFLLPFKALMASPSPIQLSIYLEPCDVDDWERLWLEKIAGFAKKKDPIAKDPLPIFEDPAAESASLRCASAARRLLTHAFLISVQVVAPDGNQDAAISVANSMQALCVERRETDEVPEEETRPGARVLIAGKNKKNEARKNYLDLEFPRWSDLSLMPEFLRRLPYLSDARGSATLFRLPVSVRGGVPGVEVEQPPPDFNPGPRSDQKAIRRPARVYRPPKPRKTMLIGKFESAGHAYVDLDDFTKHTLITGFTGSGKTQTVLHLLHQFWADHKIPFLVIESAKTEYRGLLKIMEYQSNGTNSKNIPNLLIYSLGNESLAPLRFNPFELLPGVRVESHVNRLQTCFEAAMPPFAPLPSVIEQSLIEIYRDLGWMMTDEGVAPSDLGPHRRYPVMSDLAAKAEVVGISRGYKGENEATLLAAIRGRIRPLTRVMHSSKGRMLDTPVTHPSPSVLFSKPAILEMNDLNEQDKALISMFLLTLLREYREQEHRSSTSSTSGKLRHITVVEEAHNVLENVKSVGAQEGAGSDTRHKAVQAFCGMLAEIRALGEGLIIADQSPEKLAPDAMRNTNIQIAHQLRDARDREAIANAMIMSEEQREYLGKLKPGYAGVFYTGLQRASFVKIPQFDSSEDEFGGRGSDFRSVLFDKEVAQHMEAMTKSIKQPDRPFAGCQSCGHIQTCDFRWSCRSLTKNEKTKERFLAAFAADVPLEDRTERIAELVDEGLASIEGRDNKDAPWCYLLHLRHSYLIKADKPGAMSERELHTFFRNRLLSRLKSVVGNAK